jgi:hypothetical protein
MTEPNASIKSALCLSSIQHELSAAYTKLVNNTTVRYSPPNMSDFEVSDYDKPIATEKQPLHGIVRLQARIEDYHQSLENAETMDEVNDLVENVRNAILAFIIHTPWYKIFEPQIKHDWNKRRVHLYNSFHSFHAGDECTMKTVEHVIACIYRDTCYSDPFFTKHDIFANMLTMAKAQADCDWKDVPRYLYSDDSSDEEQQQKKKQKKK